MSLAKNQILVPVETDPAQNEAADQVVAILTGHAPFDEDGDWGIPAGLAEQAGRALANRYCFAIEQEDDGKISVLITPIRHFEEEGACSDQSGPVDTLLPPRMGNLSESTWEFYADHIRTPQDAARELQNYGFYWHPEFQDFIAPNLTQELSAVAPETAVGKVMDFLDRRADLPGFDFPDDIYEEAVKEGLAREFSYAIRYAAAEDNPYGEDAPYMFALIFPKNEDSTARIAAFIRPMLPEGESVDECMEDEWHFGEEFDTPAKIAALLSSRGFAISVEDMDMPEDLLAEVVAVDAAARQPAPKAVTPAQKPPKGPSV